MKRGRSDPSGHQSDQVPGGPGPGGQVHASNGEGGVSVWNEGKCFIFSGRLGLKKKTCGCGGPRGSPPSPCVPDRA